MATECKKLLSKGTGGRVESRNKKPWASTQGKKSSDSGESSDGKLDVSILSRPPNLYKQNGASMSQDFRKYIPGVRSSWLRENYPNGFLILSYAAELGRWDKIKCEMDGLEIGDAILSIESAAKATGMSYDKARTAFEKLEENHYWETVVLHSKTRNIQKRPIKIPLSSRVVNIPLGDVWDVSRTENPIQNPIPIPFQSHSNPIKQDIREIREDTKDLFSIAYPPRKARQSDIEKISFGKYVKLKKDEYDVLVSQHSKKFIDDLIVRMNDWIEAKGKNPYKNHSKALDNWIKNSNNENKHPKPPQKLQNYEVDPRPVQYDDTLDFSRYV
jgi:hypothetical protein